MIKLKKDKLTQAAEAISAFLHEDIFGCEEEGYTVGDYLITSDGLLLRKGGYTNEVMNEALEDFEPTPITNRKETIKLLEAHTGKKAVYLGVPSCAYRIGDFIVDKNGEVKTEEQTVDVTIPSGHYTAASLKNLIYMISAKGDLLSKAVGIEGAFKADKELVDDLAVDINPTIEKIIATVKRSPGELKGLTIEESQITFTGFPNDDATQSYTQLADLMNRASKTQKRVSAKANQTENDKYSFRVWLMSIGMKGDEYKEARKVLLSKLDGNTAFRTEEQAEKHKEKMNELSKQRND